VKLHPLVIATVAFGALCLGCSSLAFAADAKPSTEKQKFSYALGFQVGQGFKRDNLDIDVDAMAQAIRDVMGGKQPQLSIDEMRTAMQTAQKKFIAAKKVEAEKAKAASDKFFAENAKKPDVVTRESGLQYKVISTGKGKRAKAGDTITANYEGKLINGTVFDSTYRRGKPATFKLNQVIKGWQEVVPLMREGDKWKVFIPPELAYGERGQGGVIGPNEALIFEIELLKVDDGKTTK
jgi:FKBP-type peptidyl-prolyl cis-trans isomerase FklB